MKCIYCDHPYTYLLGDDQRKCGNCKRKFSQKKLEREAKLFTHFKNGNTARETALNTKMHFSTVQKYFEKFRRNLALEADTLYRDNAHRVTGYDEYLYLPKSLKIEENIHKLQHFLTLSYDSKVYNLMMPRARAMPLEDDEEKENKLRLKYLKFNKVAKHSTAQSTITNFWDYFEAFILQYKGVSDEQFIFYLKEAEWRFNTISNISS
ncbi:MAG: Transposase [uncultured Sulfurovum sp.]|uniref:Transposase n=1 Tax=uncultured Sulfurovum sp. TaxID=269237 RepID=A0A6S6SCB9_9BACT|nr:MAG: Transposase [uncultured Sulfurovum sp.]